MRKIAILQTIYSGDNPEYLFLSINSILSQSCKNFDYFIGIDGSIGDDLRKVLFSFNDKRIIVLENKENKGLAGILNDLLAKCKNEAYEYLARMDSDDIAYPDRLDKQILYLEKHCEVDVVGGAINEIDEKGYSRGKITRYPCNSVQCRRFFAKRNPIAHPTAVFRHSFFEKVGWRYPTDFECNEDTRLWQEGYKHGCVINNISDVVLNYRMTDIMFKQRRKGRAFAKSQLALRKMIKKDLDYGIMVDIYAYAIYLLMISPSWVLKIAYKILR